MKKKLPDILIQAGSEYSLSHDERAKMSHVIREYMAHKPMARTQGTAQQPAFSFVFFQRPVLAALALFIVTSSGISYAAEKALPGDTLYAIKTMVNEPARVALAIEPTAKAEVQIELAERRIEEATMLAAEGRLDTETQESLASAFETHANAVASAVDDVKTADAPSVSMELSSRFENRLVAHENVLSEVEYESNSGDDSEKSHRLSQAIHVTANVLAEARMKNSFVAAQSPIAIAAMSASEPMQASKMAATEISDVTARAVTSLSTEVTDAAPEALTITLAVDSPVSDTPQALTTTATSVSSDAPQPTRKDAERMKAAAEKSLKSASKTLKDSKKLSREARERAEGDISLATTFFKEGTISLENDALLDAYLSFEESSRVTEQAIVYLKAAPTIEKAREWALKKGEVNGTASSSDDSSFTDEKPSADSTSNEKNKKGMDATDDSSTPDDEGDEKKRATSNDD